MLNNNLKPYCTYLPVEVTQEHIDSGIPNSPWSCPIAKALSDIGLNAEVTSMMVFDKYKDFDKPAMPIGCLPIEGMEFISRFDRGQKNTLKPFKFWLKVYNFYKLPESLEKLTFTPIE